MQDVGEPVETGAHLRIALSRTSARRQVVAPAPVRAQLAHVGERDALRPVVHRFALRPAGARDPLAQVVELRLRDLDLETA
ncbi:MAG: hypothetical protein R2736_20485 [Solirubrobacterales bacterium]